jgi:branched-chain amino acid transport system substrate-binding protein
MSKSFKALGLAVSALALTCLPAAAQTKVTNEGISATEIVIGRTCPARSRSGAFRFPTA